MAPSDDSAVQLVARWQQGDEQAAAELFRRFFERLISLVRSRISANLAQRFDPEDVVQSAYRSFFGGARDGRYVVQHGSDLWQLLLVITLHKLHHQVRWNRCAKRSINREHRLDVENSSEAVPADLLARGPSAVEAVSLVDEVECVMRGLDPLQRRVLELRLQGHTLEEIVAQTERSITTVRWTLKQIKQQLEQRYQERREPAAAPEDPP